MPRPIAAEAATVPVNLRELAQLHKVDSEYRTEEGVLLQVPARTLVAVLGSLGVDAGTPEAITGAIAAQRRRAAERLLGGCVVLREGSPVTLGVPGSAHVWIELEDGGTLAVPPRQVEGEPRHILERVPLGYHRLHARLGERRDAAALIVCPRRIAEPTRRLWGFAAHLYSLLSEESWGMGDLSDLAGLASWAGRTLGAGFVVVNPLHAMLPASFADHSPYWPSDRSFADPVHIRVDAVPEYRGLDAGTRSVINQLNATAAGLREDVLRGDGLIERDQVWDLKSQALRAIHRTGLTPERAVAYASFREERGQRLDTYATWCALAGRHGPDWRNWPGALSDVHSADVVRAREQYEEDVEFHRWLAWVTDEQLAGVQRAALAAGMPMGVIHDLAVGVHPSGAEAWALRRCIASGISVGAPPDVFNARGQDWCLPPWRPDMLAAEGYAPYATVLRSVLRHAGALRLDHAMGLFRLWWVPEGYPVGEGTYVHYDHEAMLAVLTLEAHRAGVPVIGEDLGTVETGVREQLSDRGIMGTSILWMERRSDGQGGSVPRPASEWRRSCLAALTNHDLPSTASRLTGRHVDQQHRHGMLPGPFGEARSAAAAERGEWLEALRHEELLPADVEDTDGLALALHRFLLRTPAGLVCVWLPDSVGDLRSPNLPGVFGSYPNWQLPVSGPDGKAVSLERLTASASVRALAEVLRECCR
ncbi:4-alpha-glucanotransferase [Streptomyces sp. NPDC020898]|uniref:4-alpha-glucanotransferase n=1 Tax=Streptomyces sp. NPDC020898 TaxID=3365101 RepID=UPI0037A56FC6